MTVFREEDIIHADETVLRVLKRDGKQVDRQSRCCMFCSGKGSERKMYLYLYHPTRSAKVVEDVLDNYCSYLQTDGYSVYNAAVNAKRLGCLSHARCKWVECLPRNEVYEQRLKHAKPLLERYWKLLKSISAVGGTNLDKAVNYSLNSKKGLETFLLDGKLELTNNRAELAVKPFVMGRKIGCSSTPTRRQTQV